MHANSDTRRSSTARRDLGLRYRPRSIRPDPRRQQQRQTDNPNRAHPTPRNRYRQKPGNVTAISRLHHRKLAVIPAPRAIAAGADFARIDVLDMVREPDGVLRSFDVSRHVGALRALANQRGDARLIVIDPISAYLGGTDSHKNADVRAASLPLSELASEIGAAVVIGSHLNKGGSDTTAMSRVTGSDAFVAAARSGPPLIRPLQKLGNQRTALSLATVAAASQSAMADKNRNDFVITV